MNIKNVIKMLLFIVFMIFVGIVLIKLVIPNYIESPYEFYNMRSHIREKCPSQRIICVGCDSNGNGACAYSEVMKGVKYVTQPHNNNKYIAKYGSESYDENNEKYCTWCDLVQGYNFKMACVRECNAIIGGK